MSYTPMKVKDGNTTKNMTDASGNESITGVGFKPKVVFFTAVQTATSKMSIGWGTVDTGGKAMADNNAGATGTWVGQPNQGIRAIQSPSDEYAASMSSYDDNGFTLAWTKTGSPTGTLQVYWLAIG